MSAIAVRSHGYHPETEIHCDQPGCASNDAPPSDWSAGDARRMARHHGWTHAGAEDYCAEHAVTTGAGPGKFTPKPREQ